MTVDGRRQRRALTAVERAVHLLAAGDASGARRAAATASELDQLGAYSGAAESITSAAAEIESSGALSEGAGRAVRDALPPGPVAAAAEKLLGRR